MPNYRLDPIVKHRREVRTRLVLPVVVATFLLMLPLAILLILTMTGDLAAQQVNAICSVMAVTCIFVPLILIMLVLDALFIGLAWGSGKINTVAKPLLRAGRRSTESVATLTGTSSRWAGGILIGLETRLMRWGEFSARLVRVRPLNRCPNVEENEKP